MSEEGQLYKKMEKISRDFEGNYDDLSFENLKPVLDEAKTDFPKDADLVGEWDFEAWEDFYKKAHDWFLKWFGEVKKQ